MQFAIVSLLSILLGTYLVVAVNMSDDKQSDPKEEASTSVQPEKVLLDLNLPALPTNEDAKEVDTPKSRIKKKKPKRVHFPSLTKEKRREMWREEKRRTRAKLTPEVLFARHKHDREVKKEKFKNAVSFILLYKRHF